MIICLTGENSYEIAQIEKALISDFISRYGEHGLQKIDGELFDPRDFSGLLQGMSLFATARLVIINDLAKNKTAWESLADWLDRTPNETTLLVVEPAPDKRTKTYKALKAKTDFKEFNLLDSSSLTGWCQEYVKNLGAEIGRVEAQNLINRVGLDQWRLSAELEKLANFNPKITLQNIELLTDAAVEGTAFELLDAAMSANTILVTKLINQLKIQEDPYKFFGLLASQVHSLAVVVNAGSRSPDTIAKEAGLHPFVVRKTQGLARRLGDEKVKKIAAQVVKCDRQLKSTGADPWDLLSLTLQRIAV